jgi:hypothetical protein
VKKKRVLECGVWCVVLCTEGDRPAALRSAAKPFASVTGPWFQLSSARAERVVPVLALASSPATSAFKIP